MRNEAKEKMAGKFLLNFQLDLAVQSPDPTLIWASPIFNQKAIL